jgi:hypothetical protein
MISTDQEIILLKATVVRLESRLVELAEQHRREIKALVGCDDILDKHRKAMDAELNNALERIAHLELTLFPRLAKSIKHLNDVIGEEDTKAYNPLDFRDPSKKSR